MVCVKDHVKNLNQKAAARVASRPGDKPPGPWAGIPMDIMRLVVDNMRPVDVQSTLLVCKEWHDGFASGLLKLKPRALKVDKLAARWAMTFQDTCTGAAQHANAYSAANFEDFSVYLFYESKATALPPLDCCIRDFAAPFNDADLDNCLQLIVFSQRHSLVAHCRQSLSCGYCPLQLCPETLQWPLSIHLCRAGKLLFVHVTKQTPPRDSKLNAT